MVGNLDLVGDIFAADLIHAKAKSAAFASRRRAFAPTERSDTLSSVFARWIAQSSTLFLVLVALKGLSDLAAISMLRTRDTNVGHTLRAIRRADAASDIVEAWVALDIPEVSPFLTVWSTVVNLTGSSSVGIGLVTVSTIVTECFILGAVLPAYRTHTRVSFITGVIAEGSILLFVLRAGRQRFSSCATGHLFPA